MKIKFIDLLNLLPAISNKHPLFLNTMPYGIITTYQNCDALEEYCRTLYKEVQKNIEFPAELLQKLIFVIISNIITNNSDVTDTINKNIEAFIHVLHAKTQHILAQDFIALEVEKLYPGNIDNPLETTPRIREEIQEKKNACKNELCRLENELEYGLIWGRKARPTSPVKIDKNSFILSKEEQLDEKDAANYICINLPVDGIIPKDCLFNIRKNMGNLESTLLVQIKNTKLDITHILKKYLLEQYNLLKIKYPASKKLRDLLTRTNTILDAKDTAIDNINSVIDEWTNLKLNFLDNRPIIIALEIFLSIISLGIYPLVKYSIFSANNIVIDNSNINSVELIVSHCVS